MSRTKPSKKPSRFGVAPVTQGNGMIIARRPLPLPLWLMRLCLAVGVPLVLIVLVELILRVTGFGYVTDFFIPARIDGQEVLIQNDRFGWRFFGRDLARQPFPLAIPKIKQRDSVRIFVFGESAAYGDPQPEFGLARMLETLLRGRYPEQRFELVNVAMTAINSHVILEIARNCAEHQADAWVVYMGNNEVVGPFGPGTVFGKSGADLALIRASLALKGTRIGQLLDSLVGRLKTTPYSKREWGGMQMFVGNKVRQDDPRMSKVYRQFEENTRDILDLGQRSGAKVLISTVASNLKDCAPFASLHQPGLPIAALGEWERLYGQAVESVKAGRTTDAVNLLRQASNLDDSYADLHYVWGRCDLASGAADTALAQFKAARDLDVLRFRADSRINEIIRKLGVDQKRHGVVFVDGEAVLTRQTTDHIAGNELLYEHVHLKFKGNYLLARAFAEEIARQVSVLATDSKPANTAWPSEEECARRLAWSDWSRCEALAGMVARINDAPFTLQINHAEQYQKLLTEVTDLQAARQLSLLSQAESACRQALALAPGDWVLHRLLAAVFEKQGHFEEAANEWRRVVQTMPYYAAGWQELGNTLAEAKHDAEAVDALEHSTQLDPGATMVWSTLAELSARAGHQAQAISQYERALRIKPYWSPAHLGLGKVLEAAGRTNEAQLHYKAALATHLNTPSALNALAGFCFEKGWLNEAIENFSAALKLSPWDASAHVNLGQALAMTGRRSEAQAHYEEALRLDPNLAEVHVRLGLEYGRQGRDASALEQFAQAVRLKPDFLEARLNLGIALLHEHREAEALEQFQEAHRLNPANPVARKYIQRLKPEPPPVR
jgi:tetratricopeptide (TPR) repeat protein